MKRQNRSTRRSARLLLAVAAAGIALPVVTGGGGQTFAGTTILRQSVTHNEAGTTILRRASISPNGTTIL